MAIYSRVSRARADVRRGMRDRSNRSFLDHLRGALLVLLVAIGQPLHAASVAAGGYLSYLLRDDGTLWGWGGGIYGELGEGTSGSRSVPVPILTAVRAVAGGANYTVALKTNGTVWAFGRNQFGQIGNGTIGNPVAPVQILSDVVAIATGSLHSMAIKDDGTLWAWGVNFSGQLGDGTVATRTVPVRVMSDVVAIVAGAGHSLAIKKDGTLWAWGSNSSGQLGLGTTGAAVLSPVQIGTDVEALAAGGAHSLALKKGGELWGWGSNFDSQLGIETSRLPRPSPTLLMTGVRAISACQGQSLALKKDGALFTWGRSDYLQNPQTNSATTRPFPVRILSGVESMAAGFDHVLALLVDGTVRAWGGNSTGQLGDGTTVTRGAPVTVMDDVQLVAGGLGHSLAVKKNGTLWAWGYNLNGQVGDGTDIHRGVPVQVLGDVKAVAAGARHSLAIRSDGMVWAWGGWAQLFDGTTTGSTVPMPVLLGGQAVAAGSGHLMALKTDGTLWSWGANESGQLGDGTNIYVPDAKQTMSNVKAIAAGDFHSIALKSDGTVWTWGSNTYGQLGDGSRVNRHVPAQVMTGVEAIDAGLYHSLALKTDGSVWAWGLNSFGQLGQGNRTTLTLPTKVLDGVRSIAAGGSQSIAVLADGTLLGWGLVNMSGAGVVHRPQVHPFLPAIRSVSAGTTHVLAVAEDGRLLAWGNNVWQQLGIPRPLYSHEPVTVLDPLRPHQSARTVVEYFNPTVLNGAGNSGIGHHFLTADGAEMASIDAGGSGPGWSRTGRGFRAWLDAGAAPQQAVPVHRFYARAPNSHFYTASTEEHQALRALNPANDPRLGWAYEGIAFYSVLPEAGGCPAGYLPIHRAYNNRFDADPARNDVNHRITPSFNDYHRSIHFLGYADEGIALCSPVVSELGGDLHATYGYPGATAESGSVLRSEFVFGNNGPGKADGGSIYVALPSNVQWKLSCTSRLGTTCPAASDLEAAALRTGVSITAWPAGGTLTLVATGTAPPIDDAGASPLRFAATVANASGLPDATPTNDTPPISQTALKAARVCSPVVNPESLQLGPDAQTPRIGLVIGEGCSWDSLSDSGWLTVDPPSGVGDSAVRLRLDANDQITSRSASVIIGGRRISVTQSGLPCTFSIEPASVAFAAHGGSALISITAPAGCNWTTDSGGASWLSASPASGAGSGSITLAAAANVALSGRNAAIAVGTVVIPVSQGRAGVVSAPPVPSPRPDPCTTLRLQREGDQVAPTGLSGDLGIDVIADADCSWRARSNDEWITLTAGSTSNGSGVVRYIAEPNPHLVTRQGTIAIGPKVFTVNQTSNPVETGNSDGGGDGSSGGSGGGSGGGAG